MTEYLPVPEAPWVATTTDAVTKRLPDATMDAIAASPELSATFVQFKDENGDPLVGKLVTITVNSATGEIDDITSEDI